MNGGTCGWRRMDVYRMCENHWCILALWQNASCGYGCVFFIFNYYYFILLLFFFFIYFFFFIFYLIFIIFFFFYFFIFFFFLWLLSFYFFYLFIIIIFLILLYLIEMVHLVLLNRPSKPICVANMLVALMYFAVVREQ